MIGRTFQPDVLVQVQDEQTFTLVPHPLIRHSPTGKPRGPYKCSSQHYVYPEQADPRSVEYPAWEVFARVWEPSPAIYTVGDVTGDPRYMTSHKDGKTIYP